MDYTTSIKWSEDGTTVVVIPTEMMASVLKETSGIFKTMNYNSFVRQMNLYGFKKLPSESINEHWFQNPLFARDKPDLVSTITRQVSPRNKHSKDQENSSHAPLSPRHLPFLYQRTLFPRGFPSPPPLKKLKFDFEEERQLQSYCENTCDLLQREMIAVQALLSLQTPVVFQK